MSELEHMTRDEVKLIMFIFMMMMMLMRLIVTCRQASQGWALVMISSGLPLPVVTSSSLSSSYQHHTIPSYHNSSWLAQGCSLLRAPHNPHQLPGLYSSFAKEQGSKLSITMIFQTFSWQNSILRHVTFWPSYCCLLQPCLALAVSNLALPNLALPCHDLPNHPQPLDSPWSRWANPGPGELITTPSGPSAVQWANNRWRASSSRELQQIGSLPLSSASPPKILLLPNDWTWEYCNWVELPPKILLSNDWTWEYCNCMSQW